MGDPWKVWTVDNNGETGTLLLRVGSSETLDIDVAFAGDTVFDVARSARTRNGYHGGVLVKNFGTDTWYTVTADDLVIKHGSPR